MSTRFRRQQRLALNEELYSLIALYSLRKMHRDWVEGYMGLPTGALKIFYTCISLLSSII